MKRKIILLCPLFLLLIAAGNYMSKEEAKDFALKYYSNVEKTINTGKIPTSTEEFIKMFGCNAEGKPVHSAIEFPNPLFLIDNSGDWFQVSRAESIFEDIAEFKQNHKNVTFDKRCVDYDYCIPPEMGKNEDERTFAWIHIRTEWTVNGKKSVIDDTVYVDLRYKNISRICNRIIPLGKSQDGSLEDMKATALFLYNSKRYDEAANLYYQITQKYPEDAEAWYSYGVMWFYDQGMGRKHSNKECFNAAYYCFKKSNLPKANRAISKITDGRE